MLQALCSKGYGKGIAEPIQLGMKVWIQSNCMRSSTLRKQQQRNLAASAADNALTAKCQL